MEPLTMKIDKDTNVNDLYIFVSNELSFNKIIELYKLLNHKIQFLADEPMYDLKYGKKEVKQI